MTPPPTPPRSHHHRRAAALLPPILAVALAAGSAGSAGCQSTSDLGPFTLQLQLDTSASGQCTSDSCDDFGMSCGATFMLRVLDVENGDQPVVDECTHVSGADTLCDLGGGGTHTFFNIPAHRLRIEVAAWRPDLVAAGACPADDLFTDGVGPLPNFIPQPAFAGSTYFDAGSQNDVVQVPLYCSDSAQLDQPECNASPSTHVTVHVLDIDTELDITFDQASNLSVGVAAPRSPDGTVYVIEAGDTTDLPVNGGQPVPTFAGDVDGDLGGPVCALVLDLAPQSTTSVVCSTVTSGEDPVLEGALVSKTTLDQVLAAMGGVGFPPQGLVVGRVVDHTGAPLAGVTITPDSGTVEYLNAARTGLGGTSTSTNGYFISRDAPFDTAWAATAGDGRTQQGTPRSGLVQGKLTAFILRMQPP